MHGTPTVDGGESGERGARVLRDGPPVPRVVAEDPLSFDIALVRDVLACPVRADVAVLCRTRREAARYARLLARNGVPVIMLTDYDGTPADAAKVGTVKRAKGLEFGTVFVPRLDTYLTEDGSVEPERVDRERRELFVAMTRARDLLWTGRVGASSPSKPGTDTATGVQKPQHHPARGLTHVLQAPDVRVAEGDADANGASEVKQNARGAGEMEAEG